MTISRFGNISISWHPYYLKSHILQYLTMHLLWFYDDMMAKTSIEIRNRDKLSPTDFHYNSIKWKWKQPLRVKHHTYVIPHSEARAFNCRYKDVWIGYFEPGIFRTRIWLKPFWFVESTGSYCVTQKIIFFWKKYSILWMARCFTVYHVDQFWS